MEKLFKNMALKLTTEQIEGALIMLITQAAEIVLSNKIHMAMNLSTPFLQVY